MKMTYEEFAKLWFVATEKNDVGSGFYNNHLGILGEMKDFLDWFYIEYLRLDENKINNLCLRSLQKGMRVLASTSAIGLLKCERDIEASSLNEALDCGEGLNFEYAYARYSEWKDIKEKMNIKLEFIKINTKKVDGEDNLLSKIKEKRNKGKAFTKKLVEVELGDIDILMGKFYFDFDLPGVKLKNPDQLLNKLTRSLHDKYGVSYDDMKGFMRVLDLLSGSVAKAKYYNVLDCLDNDELDELCAWMNVYGRNCLDMSYLDKTLTFAFDHNDRRSVNYKMIDIFANKQMKETNQDFSNFYFKSIDITVVPRGYWILEYKHKKNGVELNIGASIYFSQFKQQIKDKRRREVYNQPVDFLGDVLTNHICIDYKMHESADDNSSNHIKQLVDNAVRDDRVEILGDTNMCECDIIIGGEVKTSKIVDACIWNATSLLIKVKNMLIDKNLFDRDELNTTGDIISAISGSEGFRRARFALAELTDYELDVLINYVYAYGRVFGGDPKSLKIVMSTELVNGDNAEEIEEANYFSVYNSYCKTRINLANYAVVPSYYWIQKMKEGRING